MAEVGEADGNRQLTGRAALDPRPDALGERKGVIRRRLGCEQRELVPAEARSDVGLARRACNRFSHQPEGAVARLVIDFRSAQAVSLSVSDTGPGAASTEGGFGLLGLRERAALLGGTFATRTAPGQGFNLSIELPE